MSEEKEAQRLCAASVKCWACGCPPVGVINRQNDPPRYKCTTEVLGAGCKNGLEFLSIDEWNRYNQSMGDRAGRCKETGEAGDKVSDTIAERGKVYGEFRANHANIGLIFTGLIQQHYQITLPHPIPGELVALLMVALKVNRSTRVYHADNYVDAAAYLRFAEEMQKV